jgi:hypothetical protein
MPPSAAAAAYGGNRVESQGVKGMYDTLRGYRNQNSTASTVYVSLLHAAYTQHIPQAYRENIAALQTIFDGLWHTWVARLRGRGNINIAQHTLTNGYIAAEHQEQLLGDDLIAEIVAYIHQKIKERFDTQPI